MKITKWNTDWFVSKKQGTFGMVVQEGKFPVTLPDDAMIREKRTPDAPGSYMAGFFPKGIYEYEKSFTVEEGTLSRKRILQFDGVMERAKVYVNGAYAGGRKNGYTQFFVDLTPYLTDRKKNTVKVVCSMSDSARWYSGAGIYRDVWLLESGLSYLEPNELKITTKKAGEKLAVIETAVKIMHLGAESAPTFGLVLQVTDPNGVIVCETNTCCTVLRDRSECICQQMEIADAKLWSDETPDLYTCKVFLSDAQGKVLDEAETAFGIRTVAATHHDGLLINGKSVLLRGACVHHDNGPLGAVSTDAIEERKAGFLKEAGFNAIRTAHNPASPAMLRACDKVGLYVMEEFFDSWTLPKTNFDYAMDFDDCWKEVIASTIDKSWNHPSVIFYSIGNENADTGYATGAMRARELAQFVKRLDPSRLSVNAINGMVSVMSIMTEMFESSMQQDAKPEERAAEGAGQEQINNMMVSLRDQMKAVMMMPVVGEATKEAFQSVDIAGYNYMDSRYEMDGALFPQRIIVGSETFPGDIAENWEKVTKLPYVIGDFCWTGWDYMGEAGIGLCKYTPVPMEYGVGAPWPCLTAMCGDISISGYRRPLSYYREMIWKKRKKPYLAVQRPEYYGKNVVDSPWCWSDSVARWDFPGLEGRKTAIEVYSAAEEVELLINDKVIVRKRIGEKRQGFARFEVTYEPGYIMAKAYENGICIEETRIITQSEAIRIVPERMRISKDELAYVWITVCGKDRELSVSAEGGELLTLSCDDPLRIEPFTKNTLKTYDGRLLAIIKPGKAEQITIRCEGREAVVDIISEER